VLCAARVCAFHCACLRKAHDGAVDELNVLENGAAVVPRCACDASDSTAGLRVRPSHASTAALALLGTANLCGAGVGAAYAPAAGYYGPDSFVYEIALGGIATETRDVAIAVNVLFVNQPPVIPAGAISVPLRSTLGVTSVDLSSYVRDDATPTSWLALLNVTDHIINHNI
jgi:hypothetical protein